jgi:hypothetical protein
MERINLAISQILDGNPAGQAPKEIARQAGMSLSYLHSLAEAGESVPLARMDQIYSITGDTRHIDALCRRCDGIYLPVKDLGKPTTNKNELIKAVKESSDFIQAAADALLDGRVTPDEFVKIEREAMYLHKAVARFVALARESAGTI